MLAANGIPAAVPLALREPEGNIYGPAGLSCGVRDIFPKFQFIFHLLPVRVVYRALPLTFLTSLSQIFIASLLAAFLYSFIFLVLRGTLMIKGGIKLTLDPNSRWDGANENYHKFVARVARSMLWCVLQTSRIFTPSYDSLIGTLLVRFLLQRPRRALTYETSLYCTPDSLLCHAPFGDFRVQYCLGSYGVRFRLLVPSW